MTGEHSQEKVTCTQSEQWKSQSAPHHGTHSTSHGYFGGEQQGQTSVMVSSNRLCSNDQQTQQKTSHIPTPAYHSHGTSFDKPKGTTNMIVKSSFLFVS